MYVSGVPIGGSCHKYHFDATNVVSRQASFVATKDVFCRDRHMLSRQNVSGDKILLAQLPPMTRSPTEHSGVTSCYLQLYSDKIKSILSGERNACVAEFYCHRHLGNHTHSSGDLFPFPEVSMVLYVTETTRLIRDGEKGGRGYGGGGEGVETIYLSLHCHHQNDFCIKVGSDERHLMFIIR